MLRWALLAVLLTVAVAALDEWHQTFLADCAGKPTDVLLDTAGALAMQSFTLAQSKLRRDATPNIKPI